MSRMREQVEKLKKKRAESARKKILRAAQARGAKDPQGELDAWDGRCARLGKDPNDVRGFVRSVNARRRRFPERFSPQSRKQPTSPTAQTTPVDLSRRNETAEQREESAFELQRRIKRLGIPVPPELAVSSATLAKYERPHANDDRLPRKATQATERQPGPQKPNPEAERQRRQRQDKALQAAGIPLVHHGTWGKPN